MDSKGEDFEIPKAVVNRLVKAAVKIIIIFGMFYFNFLIIPKFVEMMTKIRIFFLSFQKMFK
jgi:hypothetical protein